MNPRTALAAAALLVVTVSAEAHAGGLKLSPTPRFVAQMRGLVRPDLAVSLDARYQDADHHGL